MRIKGVALESGKKPVICIPVMGTDKSDILEEAKRVIGQGAVMIEWRIDYMSDFNNKNEVREILAQLKEICEHTVLLVTLRTKEQGGRADISKTALEEFYLALAEMKLADLIDVEFFALKKPKKLLSEMKKHGARIITSHHDFTETPTEAVMYMLFEKMAEGGADIVKLAVMPLELQDVLNVLRVTCRFAEDYAQIPVASMAMGSKGIISRVCGEVFGSCITFGTMGKSSAPGQIPENELSQVLDIIHHNFER